MVGNVKIRQFQHSDAEHVASLIRQTLIEVNSQDYSQAIIQNMINHYQPNNIIQRSANRLIYVAVERNDVVGTISLTGSIMSGMFIHPECHDKDIGTKMMNYIESIAQKKGYSARVITAYDFYLKRGYQPLREEYSKKYGKTIVMEKSL